MILHVFHAAVDVLQPALSESLTMSDLLPQGIAGVRAPCRLPKLRASVFLEILTAAQLVNWSVVTSPIPFSPGND